MTDLYLGKSVAVLTAPPNFVSITKTFLLDIFFRKEICKNGVLFKKRSRFCLKTPDRLIFKILSK